MFIIGRYYGKFKEPEQKIVKRFECLCVAKPETVKRSDHRTEEPLYQRFPSDLGAVQLLNFISRFQ